MALRIGRTCFTCLFLRLTFPISSISSLRTNLTLSINWHPHTLNGLAHWTDLQDPASRTNELVLIEQKHTSYSLSRSQSKSPYSTTSRHYRKRPSQQWSDINNYHIVVSPCLYYTNSFCWALPCCYLFCWYASIYHLHIDSILFCWYEPYYLFCHITTIVPYQFLLLSSSALPSCYLFCYITTCTIPFSFCWYKPCYPFCHTVLISTASQFWFTTVLLFNVSFAF